MGCTAQSEWRTSRDNTEQTDMTINIHWPVLLRYEGDPELTVIRLQSEWLAEYAQHFFSAQDRLIDSEGQCFLLQQRISGQIIPHPAGVRCPELETHCAGKLGLYHFDIT